MKEAARSGGGSSGQGWGLRHVLVFYYYVDPPTPSPIPLGWIKNKFSLEFTLDVLFFVLLAAQSRRVQPIRKLSYPVFLLFFIADKGNFQTEGVDKATAFVRAPQISDNLSRRKSWLP